MITSLLEFRSYLKTMLGNPVTNVEVDDTQIDQVIEDSVQIFQRYSYGDATYRDVLTFSLSANVSAYQLDSSIDSVLDLTTPNFNTISDLFTLNTIFCTILGLMVLIQVVVELDKRKGWVELLIYLIIILV